MAVDERTVLLKYLDAQRQHVLGILEGLAEGDLLRSPLPSRWNPAGLIQHLAIDVERFWFRAVVAGEQDVIASLDEASNAWEIASGSPIRDVFDLYRQEIDQANAIIDSTLLQTPPLWWPDFFGEFRLRDLREVMLHVVTETACHAGHLDAVRELIDGRKWLVLTE
jgi:hypothetical protein